MQPTPSRRQVLQGCACLGLGGLLGGRWAGYAQAADKPPAAPAMQAHERRVAAITPPLEDEFPPRSAQPAGGPLVKALPQSPPARTDPGA